MISVVLPTFNERENIAELIKKIENVTKKYSLKSEILVIDDDSPDGTGDVVKILNKKYRNIRLVIRKEKRGVGSAHYDGYRLAVGDIIISMDADQSHDPEKIPELLRKISDGYDIVVGSRHMKGSFYEKTSLKIWLKYIFSKTGNILTSFLSGIKIHDFTNGYRAINTAIIKNIQTESTENSFLMEFIIKAHKKGYKISEIPVTFLDRKKGKSKLKLGNESFNYFIKLFKYVHS